MRILFTIGLTALIGTGTAFAQKTIKEYVEKNEKEKIKKAIVMAAGAYPVTAGGYDDGHGKNPLLLSADQIPDTIALVSWYIYDLGSMDVFDAGNTVVTVYHSLSESGGNIVANAALNSSISQLKEAYAKMGKVLLVPEEFLDTPEKKEYYYKTFAPNVSKIGGLLNAMESAHNDIAVTADGYRCFELGASSDYLRSESLGSDLAKVLGVDGVLSISIEIQSNGKAVNAHGVKMALHGPNPIPREDKKYVGQKTGTGYYNGQLYAHGYFFFNKPLKVSNWEKKQLGELDFDGMDVVMACFTEKFQDKMLESIEKASKKYKH